LRNMLGAAISELFSGGPVDAILFASWVILPSIGIGWLRQMIASQRISLDFSLRRLESIELNRATLLYERVCNNLKEIERLGADCKGSLRSRYRHRTKIRRQYSKELDDLRAYAHHLRAMIIRIRGRPLQRFRSWAHTLSSRFAFSYALALYVLILALLLASLYLSQERVWTEELTIKLETLLIWKSVREPLLYANVIASGLAAIVMPVFYFVRRTGLCIEERAQIRWLKEFASTDPDSLSYRQQDSKADENPPQEARSEELSTGRTWFLVLELSPSATIEEIKKAYTAKIKQNHPDRVHGMAPTFRDLAEVETKKLNAAYEEALISFRLAA
jgi:hypothetical protein